MMEIKTSLAEVTVYPDRARVTRSGSIRLEPGLHQLEITELPLSLDPDSARAAARGTAQARLVGLQVQRAYFAETPGEQVKQLEAQIEALQDEKHVLEAQVDLAKGARANLLSLAGQVKTYAVALVSGEMSLEAQLDLFEGLRARVGELDKELIGLAARKRDIERQLVKLNKELERWRGAPQREAYTAVIEVEALSAGELIVELTYVVSGARWEPLYDLRLVEEAGVSHLEVGYLAQVSQRSGEAWPEVELALSTARPALAGTLPELDPWYVRPLPPPQPRPIRPALHSEGMERSVAMTRKMDLMVASPAAEEVYEEAQPVMASVDSSGASITYQVPATASIPADGTPHKVTIAQYRLEPRLDYVSAPKLVEAAYRRARAANDSAYTLLPGPANLFAGDEFVGATQLDLIAPQGEIELYLGVDDRLKVERELKRREVDKKIIGGRRRIRVGYEITIENLLPGPAQITLHDQMPVSRHEDVKIRLEAADPQPAEQSELNLLDWKLNLAPKEKRVVRFDFSVESPQGMELLGMP